MIFMKKRRLFLHQKSNWSKIGSDWQQYLKPGANSTFCNPPPSRCIGSAALSVPNQVQSSSLALHTTFHLPTPFCKRNIYCSAKLEKPDVKRSLFKSLTSAANNYWVGGGGRENCYKIHQLYRLEGKILIEAHCN